MSGHDLCEQHVLEGGQRVGGAGRVVIDRIERLKRFEETRIRGFVVALLRVQHARQPLDLTLSVWEVSISIYVYDYIAVAY